MIEKSLDEKLQLEMENLKNLRVSDLNGRRLVSNFASYINKNFELLATIQDQQELLSQVVSLLRGSPKVLEEISFELNASRREQAARAQAINDCRDILAGLIEDRDREDERVRELADKIKEDGTELRKVGDRPIKLKEVRKAHALIEEEAENPDEEQPQMDSDEE